MTQPPKPASKIIGTGAAFPKGILTNAMLADRVQTSNEWIVERTGIRERHIADPKDPNEYNSSLGLQASIRALEMAGKRPEDVDQILYATCTGDTPIPSTACWLQGKLGAHRAWAMDLNAACSGFVYGVSIADQSIRSGQVKTSLVIGADVLSAFTNWQDRSSCVLFGDGAGAVVMTASDDSSGILSTHLQSDGRLWELFQTPAGGSRMETTPEVFAQQLHKMQMLGKEIFKVAVRTLTDFAVQALEKNGMTVADVDWIVPHQANLRIIEAVAKKLGVPMSKVLINLDRYGNTSSASVPTALDEGVRDGRVKKGQILLFDVFGAGLTYGSTLVRW